MFIVCCKYTNIYYKLCIYWIFFIISLFNSVFGEVKGGRYFTTTLLTSDLSPVSPKNLIKRAKREFILTSEREDFIKIESTTKFAKIRIANLIPIHFVVPKCSLSYLKILNIWDNTKTGSLDFISIMIKKRTTKNCSLVVRLYNGCNLTNSQITSSGSS